MSTAIPDHDDRERIIAAAWDVLGRTSYENLKVTSVIRIAGVSTGSFYRNFSGKPALVAELFRREMARATAILDDLTTSGTPEDRVRAWVDAVVSLAYGHKARPRARWFTSLPPEVLELIRESPPESDPVQSLHNAIADGKERGLFRAANPWRDARLIHSLCLWLDQAAPPWLGQDRDEGTTVVADFVLAALSNPVRGIPGAARGA